MAKPQKKKQQVGVPEVRSSNTPLLIGAGVLVVGILIVAAIITLAGGGDKTDTSGTDANGTPLSPFQAVTVTGQALAAEPTSTGTADPAVGTVAPTLDGKTFAGDPVSIKPDGQPKIVMFLAHWCPHCNAELPIITKFINDNGSKYSSVRFVAITTGSSPQQIHWPPYKWIADMHYPLPVMADDEKDTAANAMGLSSYPYLVSLDGANKVIARTSGEMPVEKFEQFVQTAAATAPGATTTTTAPGAAQTTVTTGASSPAAK